MLSTIVDRLHKQCEPNSPLHTIILEVYKHLAQHPDASIARMIPSNILHEFISWFDLNQHALTFPLTPSSKLDDGGTQPSSIYASEISYLNEDIQSLAKHYKGMIDEPSGNQTSKSKNTWVIINTPSNLPYLTSSQSASNPQKTISLSC